MPSPIGDLTYIWPFWAAGTFGYLLGSIPFGLVLTRLAGLGDVRDIGSGSIGATNVLRTGNKSIAALTLVLDGGKGAAAVFLGAMYGPDTAVLAGAGAFIGHLFPIWLKFRGGKGMATFIGVMLVANWPAGLFCCLTWLAMAALFRYSSLASLTAALVGPGYAYWFGNWQIMELAAFMTVLVFVRHHQIFRSIVTGAEPTIGAKK